MNDSKTSPLTAHCPATDCLASRGTLHLLAYVATGLSNGRSEGVNGKVRTITRRAFGFHGPWSLIALIFLCCSGITVPAASPPARDHQHELSTARQLPRRRTPTKAH